MSIDLEILSNFMKIYQFRFWYQNLRKYAICENVIFLILDEIYASPTCTYMHTQIYIHIHTYTHTHIHIHIYIYTHPRTYALTHIHIYIYIYVYIHMNTYTGSLAGFASFEKIQIFVYICIHMM
jgi:hypothetical protein